MCSSFPLHFHHYLSIQTLTTLDLGNNHIGDHGPQHLAQALQNNTVRQVFFLTTTDSPLSFNTDTHHAQSWIQPYRWPRSTTSCSSITKQHGARRFLFQYVFTIIFQCRNWPPSILDTTKSVIKEPNILLKHYKTTPWDKCFSLPLRIHHYLSIQTLTKLNLEYNQIGVDGARHLAQALQNNTVRDLLFFSTAHSPLSFNTDTHHAQSWQKLYWWSRNRTSYSSITKQHGERYVLLFHYVFIIIFPYRHSPRLILD